MGLRNKNLFITEKCFFVTTTCNKWLPLIKLSNSFSLIEDSLAFTSLKYETDILGYVIMPNHIHIILYFKRENKLSSFMRDFKKFTSSKIRQKLEEKGFTDILTKLKRPTQKQLFKIWIERYDDVCVKSKIDLEIKLNYIHNNPLQSHWNLVKMPYLYPFSSALFYEKMKQNNLKVIDYREYF